ncbi:bifunctional glutamate--cysteine ligase GshA/glutathione synthetase GshB [Mollicutes bacterium LVI A0039]|nr:bifunctional glutamate--cysteine ligase GshA/glutathione synthetase GshB [Mollicutes bacterium LVI A0039]
MEVMVGVEKECLIFDQDFKPVDLDLSKLPREAIVDFANHQLEIVLEPHKQVMQIQDDINRILENPYFNNKFVWPLSMPMDINEGVKYDKLDKEYRSVLAQKYGIEKMLYSGIHFNYSNDLLQTKLEYFELIQKVIEYLPIIIQFTSFSPYAHHSQPGLRPIGKNYGLEDSLSLRVSNQHGFTNDANINIDFSSYQSFEQSKQTAIYQGGLIDEREIYTKIRLKSASQDYIELRFLDINPFVPAGISDETLVFVESCLNYLSMTSINNFDFKRADMQVEQVALHGRNRDQELTIDGTTDKLSNLTITFLDQLIANATINTYIDILKNLKLKYIHNQLDVDIMCKQIERDNLSLQQFGLKNMHKSQVYTPVFPEYNMELSTKLLMKAAIERGLDVTIESPASNIIQVADDRQSHYLIQATKTNLDGYATVLLMEDKYMTKKILSKHQINVPHGIKLSKGEDPPKGFDYKVVVKPIDTNFGLGISICDGTNSQELESAIATAFTYSNQILIEKFITGNEYRMLVIDGKVESIVTRKNANVIGDGISTISELIAKKNQSSMRSTGYRSPLEKIIIDEDLIRVIIKQGYNLDSVVDSAVTVLLRNTSNVSQGGDSHEVFEVIPENYKQIAVNAAKAFDATICGVDMIIDFETQEYAIIEVNYNPAIHMHMHPYRGRGKNVADKVLDALFKN